nr:transposase [Donghicola mangrovi]
MSDGRIEIVSNAVENLIRPIALTRKNALFAGHDEGARAWGRIASQIATAKVNDVEPFA